MKFINPAFIRHLHIMACLAGSPACSFSGTEVGNGVKPPKKEPTSGVPAEEKSNKSKSDRNDDDPNTTNETLSSEGSSDRNHSGSIQGNSMECDSQECISEAQAPMRMPRDLKDLSIKLMTATCASPFAKSLAPVWLKNSRPSGSTIAEIKANLASSEWTVTEISTSKSVKVKKSSSMSDAFQLETNNTSSEDAITPLYECTPVRVDTDARLNNVNEAVTEYYATIKIDYESFDVSWHLSSPTAGALPQLYQYRIWNSSSGELLMVLSKVNP